MTIEEFDLLGEDKKGVLIFEADKIAEKVNEFTKFELFVCNNFFIETKTSINYNWKRAVATYTLNTLPLMYAGIALEQIQHSRH